MEAAAQELATRDELIQQFQSDLTKAQQCLVKATNKHRQEVRSNVGENLFS